MEWTRNKNQHTKLTPGKKILPPLLLGFELATFWSRVQHSYQQAVMAPQIKVCTARAPSQTDGPNSDCHMTFTFLQCRQTGTGFLQFVKVFESLGKMVCSFQGFKRLWKMNDSTKVFESLCQVKSQESLTLRVTSLTALYFGWHKL